MALMMDVQNGNATLAITWPWEAGYKCIDCEQLWDANEVQQNGPVYECQCGAQYSKGNSADGGDSHRCPDCNKFGSRVDKHDDHSCPECDGAMVEQADIITCPECDERIEGTVDAWLAHLNECTG